MVDEKTQQLIRLAVSVVSGCDYCVAAHRALAIKNGAGDDQISGVLEISAMMSAFNSFLNSPRLTCDITA